MTSITIRNPHLGLVTLLPIGMCQVSSVVLTVKAGDNIKKGDEVSYFQFGGSDCVLVFQEKAKVTILGAKSKVAGQKYLVGEALAWGEGSE